MDLRRITDLRCRDNRAIPAISVTPKPVRSGAVLIHDFGACKERMLRMAFALGEMGVACLALDFAGHGENRSALGPRIRYELEAAITYMRGIAPLVGCAGVGFGGRLALMSSADYVVAILPLLGVRMFDEEQWVREEVERLGTAIESAEGELLAELGPLQLERKPVLLLYPEDADSSALESAFAFQAAHSDVDMRKIAARRHGPASSWAEEVPASSVRQIRRELPFDRDASEIAARWLAQLPGFLHPAGAIDE